jgi:hypothetical protein
MKKKPTLGSPKKHPSAFSYQPSANNPDDLGKILLERHPGESRGPELLEITGFRLPPE